MNARLACLSERMGEVAAQLEVPYFALFPLLVNNTQWMDEVRASDGAHPRATGYAGIAVLVETSPAWWFKPRHAPVPTARRS